MSDMRSLSGGERSFCTVCFVLSLWAMTDAPFRALDAFDVCMVRSVCIIYIYLHYNHFYTQSPIFRGSNVIGQINIIINKKIYIFINFLYFVENPLQAMTTLKGSLGIKTCMA